MKSKNLAPGAKFVCSRNPTDKRNMFIIKKN